MNAREKLLAGASALALGVAMLAAPEADAQQFSGTTTTQSGYKADAATFFAQSAGGRTTCSTSQDTVANLTITITPPAGNFVYLTGVYIEGLANATGATSTTVWSSTNLSGSPAWLSPTTASAAANPTGFVNIAEVYPTAIRSTAAGTAVTILPQATTSSAFLCAHAVGYFNPQ
jgi:hypothetical protein